MPQFPFAIDWYEVVAPRAETHLHVQEIDTGWKMSDEDYADWLQAVRDSIRAVCEVPSRRLHVKHRERQRGLSQYEKNEDAVSEAFLVEEAGHRFELNFDTYLDTGLFLDHRPTRAHLAEVIRRRAQAGAGTRFLNLFAYTGSFTVYAAKAGASESTTIDLSNTYQAWSARNFGHNGIDGNLHRLVRADILAWLKESRERYDVILLDPPSFSNSKKMQGVLDIQRDHIRLIRQCQDRLAPGGELFFSTNLRSFELDPQLTLREVTHLSVPEDFRHPHRRPHRAWHAKKS